LSTLAINSGSRFAFPRAYTCARGTSGIGASFQRGWLARHRGFTRGLTNDQDRQSNPTTSRLDASAIDAAAECGRAPAWLAGAHLTGKRHLLEHLVASARATTSEVYRLLRQQI